MQIDINCDLGESFGVYTYGADTEMMPLITSETSRAAPTAAIPPSCGSRWNSLSRKVLRSAHT